MISKIINPLQKPITAILQGILFFYLYNHYLLLL